MTLVEFSLYPRQEYIFGRGGNLLFGQYPELIKYSNSDLQQGLEFDCK